MTARKTDKATWATARRIWKPLRTLLFWRLPGLAFWFWLLAIVGRATEEPWVSYCWVICLLPLVGQLLGRWKRLAVLFPIYLPVYYLGIFPIAVIVDSVRIAGIASRWLLKATRLLGRWTSSAVFIGVAGCSYGGLLAALSLTASPQVLWALAWASLGLGIVVVLSIGIRWAVRPFALPNAVLGGALWVLRIWAGVSVGFEVTATETQKKIEKAGVWLKTRLLVEEHESGVSRAVRHLCIPVSLTALGGLFLLLSASFGFSYYALWSSSTAFLAGERIAAPSLPIALYYAISVGVTAPSSVLAPAGWAAFLMQGFQHAASVLMVVLVPATMFFSLSARQDEYLEGAKARIERTREFLRDQWNESVKRGEAAAAAAAQRAKRAGREKPSSLGEALYRLGVLLGDASDKGSADDESGDAEGAATEAEK